MSSAGAADVAEQARSQGLTLIRELLDGGHVDSVKLARLVSDEYGLPLFDLSQIVEEHLPTDLVPQSLIRKKKTYCTGAETDSLWLLLTPRILPRLPSLSLQQASQQTPSLLSTNNYEK